MARFKGNLNSKIRLEKCNICFKPHPWTEQTRSLKAPLPPALLPPHPALLLTLNKIQLRQELQLFGDVQLKMSEGRVSIQGEILEILNRFAQPGASKGGEKAVKT